MTNDSAAGPSAPYVCCTCGAVFSTPRGFSAHFDRVAHGYNPEP